MKKRERSKKLVLHRETLRNILIDDDDLGKAVGQENAPTGRVGGCQTLIPQNCLTQLCTNDPINCVS